MKYRLFLYFLVTLGLLCLTFYACLGFNSLYLFPFLKQTSLLCFLFCFVFLFNGCDFRLKKNDGNEYSRGDYNSEHITL